MSDPRPEAGAERPTARVVVGRRYRVLGLLVLVSLAWWAGVWAWTTSQLAGLQASGAPDISLALRELELVTDATWAWVAGVVVVHAGLLGLTSWRGDREGRTGVLLSLAFHVAFSLTWGVVAP
ncbi:MAG: hypothetical protein H6732_07300 [Alphaproteobacteria bacterium]|nr:hypothetical protein [Alphaproteobacteria bacterium]